jgi:GAF domain-containing protein
MFGLGKKENEFSREDICADPEKTRISSDSLSLIDNTDHITAALDGSNYGFAIWDEALNMICCNPRYPDIHKVREELLQPGINARELMIDLKKQGILSPNADPTKLAEYIATQLSTCGTLLSNVEFTDGTILEITADRLPDGNIVTFLRDASHEKNLEKEWKARETRLRAFAETLGNFHHFLASETPLHEVTKSVGTQLGVDRCSVWIGDFTAGVSRSISLFNHDTGGQDSPLEFSLKTTEALNALLQNSSILAIDDLKNHVLALDIADDRTYGDTVKAFLAVPIIVDGQPLGLISCVALKQPRTWTDDEKIFVTAIAGHMAPLVAPAVPTLLP